MESELSVKDVLTNEYVGVSESDTVLDTVTVMREERAGSALVVRGTDPVGIITEWDVLGLVADEEDPAETTVEDVMTTPVITVSPDRSLTDAANVMGRENIRNLVVENAADEEVLGLVTQRDVIAAAGSFQATVTPPRSSGLGADAEAEPGSGDLTRDPHLGNNENVDSEVHPNGGDEYTTQGVCEACGSLADSLWESNGQLICADCRTV
ncbi:CBS domain-containing protein [Natronobacterium texcoconense]|uniref:CBS domain-containing protein n=1 Tax=Natronobacterium texcoconense TaxID=1095778 RepID=A0A1H1CME4_NATTX|nr:CBS domain-containing protein [Natronobacterium texcoconense]SDQ65377.1 CBS domain-containing protein [Natronobacterium texcoconense]